MDIDEYLHIDYKSIAHYLAEELRIAIKKKRFNRAVIGVSGGLDSSVTLALLADAIDNEHIHAYFLPYRSSNPESRSDAQLICDFLDIELIKRDITEQIDIYFAGEDNLSKLRIGNKCARERMAVLYDMASKHNGLVIGTSNRSEIIMGYGTLFGDLACAINPLGNLFKSQVRELAASMGLPEKIVNKVPTADLWEGQTDEGEMGVSYRTIDRFSYLYFDREMTVEEIAEAGIEEEKIEKIIKAYRKNSFKGEMPYIIPLNI
ncbi:MAG: NAD+ synthase [bacterium]